MPRSIRLLALTGAAIAMLALPGTAGAATTDPVSLDFGGQPVGATSTPKPVTLTAPCSTPLVASICTTSVLDTYAVVLSTTGAFGGTTDCPAQLTPVTTGFVSCTVNLVFAPASAGPQTGTLSTGTDVSGLNPGPTVALTGTGISTARPTSSGAGALKKCMKHKKHRSAQTAKKKRCKKKR